MDGGDTWKNVKISEQPFKPVKGKFFGDYTNIDVEAGFIYTTWTRMDKRKTSVLAAPFSHDQLISAP